MAQGKVWVFGEGGPDAFVHAAAVKPAFIEELRSSFPPVDAKSGERWMFFGSEYVQV